jgi:hypothetical protein
MSTVVQKRQNFIRYYKEQTGSTEVNMHEVAKLAQKMDWRMPKPADPLDLLAKQFSEAAGEETREDKQTKKIYKANLAITDRQKDGKQGTFWVDVDDDKVPRHRIAKGLHLYREHMVGGVVIGKNTAEHWNRRHPDQPPLPFDTDMTDDFNWRANASVEEKSGKVS